MNGLTGEDIKLLFADFPKEDVSWRAQTVTKDGTKALALAYIDARNVMDRLDAICGSANWQDSYQETQSGRVICTLSIKIDGDWVCKTDGAGSTDVEGEKGGISDAFKRAAVKWGVGRYLYDLPTPWVPCKTYDSNGKKRWSNWTSDPWSFVKGPHKASSMLMKKGLDEIAKDLLDANSKQALDKLVADWKAKMDTEFWSQDYRDMAKKPFAEKYRKIRENLASEAA